jgi:ferredoxin-NAD(P)+ reductase (naphthalene dioxygenase ferredoxin-specific)
VELLKHTSFSLTDEEKAHGLILACRAQPRSDCEVAWLGSDAVEHPLRDEQARVVALADATHDIKRITLRLLDDAPLAFSAGQYAELTFRGCPPRHYSMANRPGSDALEFHVRTVPDGIASGFAATRLRVGDLVRLRGPFGNAHLRTAHAGPLVAIAGGSGLAPIVSIVDTALSEGMRQPIRVYFGARTERDLYEEDRLAVLSRAHPNLSFTAILSHEAVPGRRRGLVTSAVGDDWAEFRGWKAYVAGPPVMVEAASELLLARGLQRDDLHADAFFTTAEQATADDHEEESRRRA